MCLHRARPYRVLDVSNDVTEHTTVERYAETQTAFNPVKLISLDIRSQIQSTARRNQCLLNRAGLYPKIEAIVIEIKTQKEKFN